MPRELRKRASRPNYAAMVSVADDISTAGDQEEVESGSDFAPEKDEGHDVQEPDENLSHVSDASAEDDQDMLEDASDDESFVASTKPTKKGKTKSKSAAKTTRTPRHSLTVPSVHHRHRAIPLYHKEGTVERLTKKPALFKPDGLAFTNSWGSSRTVLARVAKAWGHNVGPGPSWELIEDRAWYGEGSDDAEESKRRPRVYELCNRQLEYEVLGAEAAKQFLSRPHATDDDQLKCSFGPFGSQQQEVLHRFSNLPMDKYFAQSSAHVFNAGAPVWGLDWCPTHADDRTGIATQGTQYLAVAPLPSRTYSPQIGVKVSRPNSATIQIWSLRPPSDSGGTGGDTSISAQSGSVKCVLVLCVDVGPAHEIRWCPLPSHDPLKGSSNSQTSPRRLGLLAGTFEDGSVSIFAVPYPPDVASSDSTDGPIYVKIVEPLVKFELEDTAAWCLDWANSEVIAVGCSNGYVAVFDVAEALLNPISDEALLPTFYASAHQSAVRSVSWVRTPSLTATGELSSTDPCVITSASYDGLVAATDIRAPCGSVIYRTRDVVNTVCFSTYAGGPISIDQGLVKAISFAPTMLNKGHTVTEPEAPVWCIDYHPVLAIGVADGSCQTTNTLRHTRKGGIVPFMSHIIYQLDYDTKTGEYRMLERILPKVFTSIARDDTGAL
ncbi:hypothetical protein BC629DRAFT_1299009 [Irpex lacteus]|nr:hypothetical protein BC629DRAFT_1299009 [Irpex lacteus]